MKFSLLQKFILLKLLDKEPASALTANRGGMKTERRIFREFYGKALEPAKEKYQENIITKSLEHLIDRELLIGYGKRTPHKWFVTHVCLTKKGAKVSQNVLLEKQAKLPLK